MHNLQETHNPIQTSTTDTSAEQERIDGLVCQITEGFVRGDEKRSVQDTRPFEELLTNLLPRAGVFARSVVSQKLCARADVPRRIIEMLVDDDAAVVEPLIIHSQLLNEDDITKLINRRDPILRQSLFKRANLTLLQRQSLLLDMPVRASTIRPATLQIAAQAATLPLSSSAPIQIDILQKKENAVAPIIQVAEDMARPVITTPIAATPLIENEIIARPVAAEVKPTTKILQHLVRAAVLRRHDELAQLIAAETGLSVVITQALLKDASGEALMAVCHYINVPEDAGVQIATLLYPALVRTREQLTVLRQLYRNFTPEAVNRIVTAWRALPQNSQPVHETVHIGETASATQPKQTQTTGFQSKQVSNQ